jgi:hypothetical protein
MSDAMNNRRWVSDLKGALVVNVLTEYLQLWELRENMELHLDVADTHIWQFSTTDQYSTKSAYEALFIGSVQFCPWEQIWKSWAPGKCKFFMWTAAHKKCWTADHLARKGLPHPVVCPICDQSEETIDHLLVSCIFSRQVWFTLLQDFGLQDLAPQSVELSFEDWWDNISKRVSSQGNKSLNSIVILGAWALWNHRNRYVFYGAKTSLANIIAVINDELLQWSFAGARGVSFFLAQATAAT